MALGPACVRLLRGNQVADQDLRQVHVAFGGRLARGRLQAQLLSRAATAVNLQLLALHDKSLHPSMMHTRHLPAKPTFMWLQQVLWIKLLAQQHLGRLHSVSFLLQLQGGLLQQRARLLLTHGGPQHASQEQVW